MFYLHISSFICRYWLLFFIPWKTQYLSIDSTTRILSSIICRLSADKVCGLYAHIYPRTFVSHLWTRFKNNPKIWYRVSTKNNPKFDIARKVDFRYPKKKKVIARAQDINPVLIASQIKIPLGKSLFTWKVREKREKNIWNASHLGETSIYNLRRVEDEFPFF